MCMSHEWITLTEQGVGPVLVRVADIVLLEPTALRSTRVWISVRSITVLESQEQVFKMILAAESAATRTVSTITEQRLA